MCTLLLNILNICVVHHNIYEHIKKIVLQIFFTAFKNIGNFMPIKVLVYYFSAFQSGCMNRLVADEQLA